MPWIKPLADEESPGLIDRIMQECHGNRTKANRLMGLFIEAVCTADADGVIRDDVMESVAPGLWVLQLSIFESVGLLTRDRERGVSKLTEDAMQFIRM